MWKNDPSKVKWPIIAKAYSSIRDVVRKQRASLATFLILVCPKLSIINVKNYFRKIGHSKLQSIARKYWSRLRFRTVVISKGTSYSSAHRWVTFHSKLPINCWRGLLQPNWIFSRKSKTSAGLTGLLPSCPAAQPAKHFTRRRGIGSPESFPLVGSILARFSEPFNGIKGEELEDQWTGSMFDLYNPAEGSIDSMLREYLGAAMSNQVFRVNQYRKFYRSLLINGLPRVMDHGNSALK